MRPFQMGVIAGLVLGSAVATVAEDVTVTTYYPSPRGVYNELRTRGLTILAEQAGSNVGIGTPSPTAKLEVAGQIRMTGGTPANNKVLSSDATGLAGWSNLSDLGAVVSAGPGTPDTVTKWTNPTTIGDSQIIDNGTNVGIGTGSPSQKLDVAGGLQTTGASFLATASGNVGIGTSAPSQRLDVAGTARMTGFLMPTGASNGDVLKSDAGGNGTWQPAYAVYAP